MLSLLSSIISILLAYLFVYAFFQATQPRKCAALIFVIPIILYRIIEDLFEIKGSQYFIWAGMTNLLTLVLMLGIRPCVNMVKYMQILCFCMALTNFFGAYVNLTYHHPALYSVPYIGLYIAALIVFTNRDGDDDVRMLDTNWIKFHCHPMEWVAMFKNYHKRK